MDANISRLPGFGSAGVSGLPSIASAAACFQSPDLYYMQADRQGGNQSTDAEQPYSAMACSVHNGRSYQGYVAIAKTTAILRLMFDDVKSAALLDNPRSQARQALINWVASGLDSYQANSMGWEPGPKAITGAWGGTVHGEKVVALGAAALLDDPTLKNNLAQGDHYFEDQNTYVSAVDNRPYWGVDFNAEPQCATDAGTCGGDRNQAWCVDAKRDTWDRVCCGSKGYPKQVMNVAGGWAMIINGMGARSIWGDDDAVDLYVGTYAGNRGAGHAPHSSNSGATPGWYCGNSNRGSGTNQTQTGYYTCELCETMFPFFGSVDNNNGTPPPASLAPPPVASVIGAALAR